MAAEIELVTDKYNGSLISLGSSKGFKLHSSRQNCAIKCYSATVPASSYFLSDSFNIASLLSLSYRRPDYASTIGFALRGYKKILFFIFYYFLQI